MSETIILWKDEAPFEPDTSYKAGPEAPGVFCRKIAEIDRKTFRVLRRRALRKSYNEALLKRSNLLLPLIVTGFALSFAPTVSAAAVISGVIYIIWYSLVFFNVRRESFKNYDGWLSQTLDNYINRERENNLRRQNNF